MELNPLTYALLAQEAYTAIPQIGKEDSSARCIIESTIDGTAFAFPGTDNIACWLADLDCGVIQTSLGKVHRGFYLSALEIVSDIEDRVSKVPQPIILTGHSEGAALALNIAGHLCLIGKPPKAVFGFEPPRVSADNKLADILAENGVTVYLTQNGYDVVPQVPRLLFPWQHPAPIKAIGEPALPFANVDDHAIGRVVESIRRMVLAPV